ncbi:MAG: hypothetical protein AABX08_00875 [Nanoarchaeota archaeon]
MEKRGQVTTFVLIGILFIVIIIGVVITKTNVLDRLKSSTTESAVLSPQVVPIRNYIQDCLDDVSVTGLRLLGLQGGLLDPQRYIETEFSRVSYGYYERKTLPSLRSIVRELKTFIELSLPLCFDENSFPGFNIEQEKVKSNVKIVDNKVEIDAKYPITAEKSWVGYKLDVEYSTTLDFDFKNIHSTAEEIVNEIVKAPDFIHISSLAGKDYDVTILTFDEEQVYSITDENGLDDIPYTFRFGVRI